MRDNEKKLNLADDQKNIQKPVLLAAGVLVILTGILVWLAVRHADALYSIRDLVITLVTLLCFIIGIVLTVLFIFLSLKIDSAKVQIDRALTKADGKVEELAEKITQVLKSILDPFIEAGARGAGVRGIFSRKKTED